MMKLINSDPTLAVGDFVFHNYSKNEFLWKIVHIERRYITKEDLRYSTLEDGKLGDEYDPLITIESVANFSITADVSNKIRKQKKILDASYLTKADPKLIEKHAHRLQKIISDLWGINE